jgi:hypothetical protein
MSYLPDAMRMTMMEDVEYEQCPRCEGDKLHPEKVLNALSRRDNETYICSDCGTEEALFDYAIHQSLIKLAGLIQESPAPDDDPKIQVERAMIKNAIIQEQLWLTDWPTKSELDAIDNSIGTAVASIRKRLDAEGA